MQEEASWLPQEQAEKKKELELEVPPPLLRVHAASWVLPLIGILLELEDQRF